MFQQRCPRNSCCNRHFHLGQWLRHWRGCYHSLEVVRTKPKKYRAGVKLTAFVGILKARKSVAQALAHTLTRLYSHRRGAVGDRLGNQRSSIDTVGIASSKVPSGGRGRRGAPSCGRQAVNIEAVRASAGFLWRTAASHGALSTSIRGWAAAVLELGITPWEPLVALYGLLVLGARYLQHSPEYSTPAMVYPADSQAVSQASIDMADAPPATWTWLAKVRPLTLSE